MLFWISVFWIVHICLIFFVIKGIGKAPLMSLYVISFTGLYVLPLLLDPIIPDSSRIIFNGFFQYSVSDDVYIGVVKMICLHQLMLLIYLIKKRKKDRSEKRIVLPIYVRNSFWVLGGLMLALFVIKIYLVVQFGYLYLFESNSKLLGETILLQLFPLASSLVFASRFSGDKSKLYVLFVLILLLSLLTGQRGFFIKNLIGIIVIYSLFSDLRLTYKAAVTSLFIVLAMFSLAFVRIGVSVKQNDRIILVNGVATSYGILSVVERDHDVLDLPNKSIFAEIRSISESFIYFIVGASNPHVQDEAASLKRYAHSGQFLSNHYNPSAVRLGKGLGTGNLIEAKLIFGRYGVLVVIVLAILFTGVDRLKVTFFSVPFIYAFSGSVFFWPRDSLLGPLSDNIILIVMLIVLFVWRNILRL